ncbi:MAG: DUF6077 domain-containing protein [Candidatus Limivivens sp.]|nr:DUF6077 domain-containing protein [Candidatus Limivivens sp.]
MSGILRNENVRRGGVPIVPVKAALTLLWLLVIPFCLGLPFQRGLRKEEKRFFYTMMAGYGVMLGSFQILAVPMVLLYQPYHRLAWIYGILAAAAALACLLVCRRDAAEVTAGRLLSYRSVPWTNWLALLLILFQIGMYVTGMFTDLDDSFYVGTATTAQYTDQMYSISPYTGKNLNHLPSRYCLSPFPIFLAFLSTVTGFSPSVMAHTIEPVFFVSLAYGIYSLIGEHFFKKDRKMSGLFLVFLSLMHLFSYYSIYTQGTFMLIRIWQGKAFLAAVLLPGIFYLGMRTMDQRGRARDWQALLWVALSACLASSMGIMLVPVMLGILGIVLGCFSGKWKKTVYMVLCCMPCLCFAAAYLLIR